MRTNLILSAALAALISGCSMAPPLELRQPELPTAETSVAVETGWWKGFGDPRLDALIDEALSHNDDYKLAAANVNLALATLGLSRAERYPRLDGAASAMRQKTSGESLSPFAGVTYSSFDLSATMGYELDLWGKLKNAEASAWSQLLATEADRDAVRIALESSVAELFVNQIALAAQIDVAQQTVDANKASLDYRLREQAHGTVDDLTVEQTRALYAGAKLTLAQLRESETLNESALSILIGRSPRALFVTRIDVPHALPAPLTIPEGLTSGLLQRRPDIFAAEARLRAANADIGVARAAYFPSISLTGSVGLQSTQLDSLFNGTANTWSFGPALSVPLFDLGRIDRQVEQSKAREEAATITYVQTVKTAFKEVYDALRRIEHAREKIAAQDEEAVALERVVTLSQKRYDAGYGDYLAVLDAKRSLLNAQTNLIAQRAEMIVDQISLYKALGGGWKVPEQ